MPEHESLAGYSFARAIPKAVRGHGRAVDPNCLEPGDLILVSRKTPDWTSRQIVRQQAKMFTDDHARWYHAAVSGGGIEICEATVGGVKCREYWRYMTGAFDLRVRRLKGADAATRNKLAYYAASASRTSYGFLNILNIAQYMRSGDDWNRRLSFSSGVICSQLYFEASMRVGYLLANIRPEAVCPAQLSVSTLLEDVALSWIKVD